MVCKEEWEADDNRWILCDLYSGIEYEEKDYYDIDTEALFFECKNCTYGCIITRANNIL